LASRILRACQYPSNVTGGKGKQKENESPWVSWRLWSSPGFVELGCLNQWCLRPMRRVCMAYRYLPEFRRKVLDMVAAGRSVASIAADLGVSDQTVYRWRKQELIDTGIERGLPTIG
jgi:hypothetical protein